MLKGKKILVAVTGGIAAYKIPFLLRELKKRGAQSRVIMTEAAAEFVTPLTCSVLSGHDVVVGTFPSKGSRRVGMGTWHISLGRWADLMLIAPATANTLAKLSHGYADDAVSTLALAARCQVMVAPSMDVDMWLHRATQENVSRLREMGYAVLHPDEGELASGLSGPGRLPGVDALLEAIDRTLSRSRRDFRGKKVLVTAGPTREAIDPVRYIGNRSSGKMGFALARAAAERGADVTLVSGDVPLETPRMVRRVGVESAAEMRRAVVRHSRRADVIIMAAAVADFAPIVASRKKIKKEEMRGGRLTLTLRKTDDILAGLSKRKNGQVVVGFALETHDEIPSARRKLTGKNLDFVILNNPLRPGSGFGSETNIVTILSRKGKVERLRKLPKLEVANEILDRVRSTLAK